MAKDLSLALGDHFVAFVETKVAEGRFASASEVVRAGLRLLEKREAKLTALRAAMEEGEASGPATASISTPSSPISVQPTKPD